MVQRRARNRFESRPRIAGTSARRQIESRTLVASACYVRSRSISLAIRRIAPSIRRVPPALSSPIKEITREVTNNERKGSELELGGPLHLPLGLAPWSSLASLARDQGATEAFGLGCVPDSRGFLRVASPTGVESNPVWARARCVVGPRRDHTGSFRNLDLAPGAAWCARLDRVPQELCREGRPRGRCGPPGKDAR